MDIAYVLSTCSTCQKIMASLPKNDLHVRDIKKDPLTAKEIDSLAKLAGSYEALFSRKAQLYKSYGLKEQTLSESDFRKYLIEHYTFLSRPVFVIDGKIYIGNTKANVGRVINALN